MSLQKFKLPILCLLVACLALGGLQVIHAQSNTGTSQSPGTGSTGTSQSPAPTKVTTLQNPLSNINSVGSLVSKFVEVFSYLVILFAVLMLVWTGLQYILARGNAEQMKKLTNRLTYIVIGIAIVIGARVIIDVIINTLSATGTINSGTINSINRARNGQ